MPFSNKNQIERLIVDEDESVGQVNTTRNRPTKRVDSSLLSQDAVVKFNRLQQLLGETNVECQSIDVFKALEDIKSLEDMATALDLVAKAPTLESKMGVEGATFQKLAVSHCKEKFDEAVSEGGEDALTNPHVQHLAFKIAYYTQLVNAFDVLHRYETSNDEGDENIKAVAPSTWGIEAECWTSTYEKITKRKIDVGSLHCPDEPVRFYAFASACIIPRNWANTPFNEKKGRYHVYLSDSSKTRKDLLVRIFKPLLGDVFSYQVADQIFEALGIEYDQEYLLKCFGEWFTSLSIKDVTKKSIFREDSPVNRWLQNMIGMQLDEASKKGEGGKQPMESLFEYCRRSEELVKAFWLATLCRGAVFNVASDREEKTYGEISGKKYVDRWEQLLRKLRMCLLVSLRLHDRPLGACPISVKAVEAGENFSVFDWLVKDELSMSQKNDEIVSLENACRISSHAFDPSTADGDDPTRFKVLQSSCLSAALSEDERAEYLVDFDDDDRLGALLLYMKPHNIGEILVAHRALQLVSRWGREPRKLNILEDAVVALEAIDSDDHKKVASAVRLEIWQSHIRPFYRAMLMGFHDVQEISADVVGPLFEEYEWVSSFSNLASKILRMVGTVQFDENENINEFEPHVEENDATWPPVVDCFMLKRLVQKNRAISKNSLQAHQILIFSLKITRETSTLAMVTPNFHSLFAPGALFETVMPSEDIEEKQHMFMQDAIVAFARQYDGAPLDNLNLGDIGALAELWDFEMENVRTLFLLSMYEYGKDRLVDELITKCSSLLSVEHFSEGGVEIVCRRLHFLLHLEPSDEIRSLMGSLDADLCEWIREKAENAEPLVPSAVLDVPIGNTHLFGLRLLSLAASAEISKEDRIKIHSLIVLSGTIVKTLDEGGS